MGQALGLPTTMALFSFIGIAVTSATKVIYGETIWDPVVVLSKFSNPVVLFVAMVSLCIATLATNIAANVVSPANDFAHLAPRLISFRTGGFITGVIGILMRPWKLVEDPTGYIFRWLVAYSALLGAVGGILVADYFVIRHTELDQAGLYKKDGPYWYSGGFNPIAILALVLGVAPCVPGFMAAVSDHWKTFFTPADPHAWSWISLYPYAWFISFALSFTSYIGLTSILGRRAPVL